MELTQIQHIEQTPGLRGGKPHIAGTRITVADVAFFHLKQGMSVDEIVATYDLSPANVHAALAYYFDHRATLDQRTAADGAFVEEIELHTSSLLQQRLRATQDKATAPTLPKSS
jgi:uncharacterized protein (DUF433 family)